jgi:hypothetical protein
MIRFTLLGERKHREHRDLQDDAQEVHESPDLHSCAVTHHYRYNTDAQNRKYVNMESLGSAVVHT